MKNILKIILILLAYTSHAQYAIEYKFDELQRIKEEKYPDGTTVTYTYDPVSNRKTKVVNRVVAGQPDITLVNSSLSVNSIVGGNNLTVSTTVSNLQATAANPNFKIRYYLSDNNLYEATDTELGAFQTITAPFTGSQNLQNVLTIPMGQVGSKYIIIKADADNEVINEVSETNNEAVLPIIITNPCPTISVSVSTTNTTTGTSTGSATASVTGGQSPYSFLWSNTGNTPTISNLSAGTYTVTATDANGCQGAGSRVVGTTAVCNLVLNANITNASCNASDGAIGLTVSNATAPLTYLWSNGAITKDLANIPQGTYFVTVSDGAGCNKQESFSVSSNSMIEIVETFDIPVSTIYDNSYDILETVNFSKIVFIDGTPLNQPLLLKSIDLGTKIFTDVTIQHPLGLPYRAFSLSAQNNNLTVLQQFINTTAPASYSMANGFSDITFDAQFNPTYNKTRYLDGYPVNDFCFSNGPRTFSAFKKVGNEIFTLKSPGSTPAGNYLDLDRYNSDIQTCYPQQRFGLSPVEYLKSYSIIRNPNSDGLFILGGDKFGNKWIDIYSNINGTYTNTSPFIPTGQPMHLTASDSKLFLIAKKKNPDNSFSYFLQVYSTAYQFLSEISLPYVGNIIEAKLGKSLSGNDVICVAYDGYKLMYIDATSNKYLNTITTTSEIRGLIYSNTYKKFITLHATNTPNLGKGVAYQIKDGLIISSTTSDTPYGTNNGSINLTISGGTATFLWSNGATTEDVSNLGEGTYSVTITPTDGGCPIVRSFQIKTNTAPPSPTVSSNPSPAIIISGSNNTVTLTASNCVGIVQWSTGETAASFTVAPSTTTSYSATCSYNNFTSQSSPLVTVSVIAPTQAPIVSTTKTAICIGESLILLSSNCSGTVNWSSGVTGNSITINITQNTSYSATCTANGSTSPSSNVLNIVVNPPTSPPTVNSVLIYTGQTATLTATGCTGTVNWYNTATGGNNIGTGNTFTSPILNGSTTYYASCIIGNCESTNRNAGIVTVEFAGLKARYVYDVGFDDISGNGNHSIPRNGVAYGTDIKGGTGNSICLDGVNDYLDAPFEQKNMVSQTISVWVKIDQANLPIGRRTLIQARGLGGAGGTGTIFGYQKYSNTTNNNNVWYYQMSFDGGLVGIQLPYENDNTWTHIIAVWSGVSGSPITSNQFSIYVNGVKQNNLTNWNVGSPLAPVNGIGTTRIGYWDGDGSNGYFKGCIDNLRIYQNQSLAISEILNIYNSEKPCYAATATISGTQTITSGQTATLSVTLTGDSPWSTVVNGVTYSNITSSPKTISVSPSTNTTYTIASVSNGCGAGTVSGNAVVTVNTVCTNMYTLKTGNWNDVSVWSCGRIPTSNDIITVKTNHFITIPASYTANAKDVVYETGGEIIGATNTSKLCLSCPQITTNGLIGYYPLNGNVNDESGSGFNGTIVGSPVFVTGTINQAIRTTPNTGQYVQIPNNNTLQNISFVSISVWVKPTSFDLGCFNEREMIVGKGQDIVTNGYGISIKRNTNAGCGNATSFSLYKMSFEYGGNSIFTPFYNVDNQWRHVLATYDRNIMKIYINGILVQQQTVGVISAINTLPVYFNYAKWNGNNNTNGRFGGDIDNIRIYNLALSDAEVLQIYNGEKP